MTSRTVKPASFARRSLVAALCAASLCAVGPQAAAETYPSKPIRLLVLTGTGTVTDMVARLLSTHMADSLGQSVVVENIPSAGGVTGTSQLVRSPADGYTIAMLNNNHVINPNVYKDLPFDSIKDIQPIGNVGNTPLVLVTRPGLPAKNLQEVLAMARAKPGDLTYGSAGNGTVLHLAGVLLTSEGQVDIRHIPYKASGQMVTDAMSGQIDMVFLGVASASKLIAAGKLHPIGVTTTKRSPLMPDLPTLAEQGLSNYNFDGWIALAGPAGLPRPVVDRLNAELNKALAIKEVQERMTQMAMMLTPGTPEQATRFFKAELDKHTDLAKRGGAKLD